MSHYLTREAYFRYPQSLSKTFGTYSKKIAKRTSVSRTCLSSNIASEDDLAVEHEPLDPCKAPLTQVPKEKRKRTGDYEGRLERKRLKSRKTEEGAKSVFTCAEEVVTMPVPVSSLMCRVKQWTDKGMYVADSPPRTRSSKGT